MKRHLQALSAIGIGCWAISALAAEKPGSAISRGEPPRDIRAGDPLRKILLDAARPTIETDLGQPVKFIVRKLRKQNQWAFAVAAPQRPDGKPIDFMRTRYADHIREGVFDSHDAYILLEHKSGHWEVRDFVIGPTDVYYAGWPSEFGAPYPLFELPVPEG